mgnify:CR=1 FL=1
MSLCLYPPKKKFRIKANFQSKRIYKIKLGGDLDKIRDYYYVKSEFRVFELKRVKSFLPLSIERRNVNENSEQGRTNSKIRLSTRGN